MKQFLQKHKYSLISVCSFLFVLLVWQLVTDVFHLVSPVMLPSPTKILETFVYKLTGGTVPDGATLFENIWSSLKIALKSIYFPTSITPLEQITGIMFSSGL